VVWLLLALVVAVVRLLLALVVALVLVLVLVVLVGTCGGKGDGIVSVVAVVGEVRGLE
jgi:hypothetical protein